MSISYFCQNGPVHPDNNAAVKVNSKWLFQFYRKCQQFHLKFELKFCKLLWHSYFLFLFFLLLTPDSLLVSWWLLFFMIFYYHGTKCDICIYIDMYLLATPIGSWILLWRCVKGFSYWFKNVTVIVFSLSVLSTKNRQWKRLDVCFE